MSMLKRLVPSPSLVIACLALLLVLGGSAYAASRLPRNSVTTVQVKNHSLLARDFRSGQLPRGPAGPPGPAGPADPRVPPVPAVLHRSSGRSCVLTAALRPSRAGSRSPLNRAQARTSSASAAPSPASRSLRRRGTRVTAPAGEAKHLPVRAAVEPKGVPALRRTTPAPSSSRPGVMLARWRITRSTSRSSARRESLRPRLHAAAAVSPGSKTRSRLAVASKALRRPGQRANNGVRRSIRDSGCIACQTVR